MTILRDHAALGSTPSRPPASCSAAASSLPRSKQAVSPAGWLDARQLIVTDEDHTAAAPLCAGDARRRRLAIRALLAPAAFQ